jgi:hypothetical protein
LLLVFPSIHICIFKQPRGTIAIPKDLKPITRRCKGAEWAPEKVLQVLGIFFCKAPARLMRMIVIAVERSYSFLSMLVAVYGDVWIPDAAEHLDGLEELGHIVDIGELACECQIDVKILELVRVTEE